MYKINVLTSGKYHNVAIGSRYCFTKRTAKSIIKCFLETECKISVEKFRKCGDCFMWSNDHKLYGGINYKGE